jgi:tripartite-type tricarboxylate transporter receptor subunit TctC
MPSTSRHRLVHLVAVVLGLHAWGLTAPASAADYYAGKTIDFIIGNFPGGGFDIYARALARHMGRHIPGKPNIVVKNLPGAGSAKAGHQVSQVSPKDGLTVGGVTPGAITGPLLEGKPNKLFDASQVTWIGTINVGTRICATYGNAKTKTFDQAMTQKTVFAGVAPGDATLDFAYMVKRTTGANIDVIAGYKGTQGVTLAMERGETDGACGWDWSSAKAMRPNWISENKLNMLLQIGPQEHPELTKMGAPPLWKFIKTEENRKVAELIVSQQNFQRPYFVAKETPPELVAILRTAFDATMKDPQFLADAAKVHIDVSPLPGARVQQLIGAFFSTPQSVVEGARQAIRP